MRRFPTGGFPSPRHKLLSATPHRVTGFTPAQYPSALPAVLEMWDNDVDGICVTAEECASKAAWSVANGLPEIHISDSAEIAFADRYGFRNGANLTDVMDKMISDGIHDGPQTYKNGPYSGVDYSNEAILQNAMPVGPVKLGISSSSLPSGAGNESGWLAFGGRGGAQDHCVGLWGFGPTAYLAQLLQKTYNVTIDLPANAPATAYIVYTWSTVGLVDHKWIMAAVGEAWVRNPTTIGVPPLPGPTPPPPPPPNNNVLEIVTAIPAQTFDVGTGKVIGPIAVGTYIVGATPPPPPPPPGQGVLTPTDVANLKVALGTIQTILGENP